MWQIYVVLFLNWFSENLCCCWFFYLLIIFREKQFLADVLQKRFLKNFENFTGKHLCWSLFLIKLQVCESYEILKNTFFHWTRSVAASVLFKGDTPMTSTLSGGIRQKWDVIGRMGWGFSECSGRPVFIFFN